MPAVDRMKRSLACWKNSKSWDLFRRDPEGNLHPAIERLKNEFFKFEGIVPCPIPPASRQPRDVVLAVILRDARLGIDPASLVR